MGLASSGVSDFLEVEYEDAGESAAVFVVTGISDDKGATLITASGGDSLVFAATAVDFFFTPSSSAGHA